ncbi:MAG: hypothetical protein VKK62_08735 [Synechococcaceae cyanobacterium]|nr:hypothetical protein [Synechococcaceae cyanobacterium]
MTVNARPQRRPHPSRGLLLPVAGRLCAWPRCCPWLVVLAGVALAATTGFAPFSLLLVGLACLLSGCFGRLQP